MIWTVCLLLSCLSLAKSMDTCPEKHDYGPYGSKAIAIYLTIRATSTSMPIIRREIVLPSNSTLLQGMLVAQYEDARGQFVFETTYHEQYGHFMKSINGVESNPPFYWIVYDARTNTTLPCGVDSVYPEDGEHFLWKFED